MEEMKMDIERKCALLVIDIQQEDFIGLNEDNINNPEWNCIRNAKRVLDVFRAKKTTCNSNKRSS